MPAVESTNPSITGLTGLHLWHDAMSSCSQRVRTVLAAKDSNWESHKLELLHGENLEPEFLAINPRGLVPVLVHDGTLLTESVDIIDYLDTTFESPSLRPDDPVELERMKDFLALADEAQYALKVLSHEFLLRVARKISDDDLETFENDVANEDLVEFVRTYHASGDALPTDLVTDCVNSTHDCFKQLDSALADREWIVGDKLTLADIAWMPNVHRFELMDWPLERYPDLCAWHDRVRSLPCYQSGISQWEPPPAREMLINYAKTRGDAGHHVRNFGVLAESS